MSDERERLLARVRAGLKHGEPHAAVARRLRLRRDAWAALAAEATVEVEATTSPLAAACDCLGTGVRPEPWLTEAAREVAALRPEARWEIDQVHTTAEDLARRVAFLLEADDVRGRRVLFVGDDDFTSALLCQVERPERVVVVDVDERILERLQQLAVERGWPLSTVRFDLTRFVDGELPQSMEGEFDTFITDPPYSESGMMLFIAFGLACLRRAPGAAAHVALPWLAREEWSDELLFRVQQALVGQGFLATDVRRAFHAYEHADAVYSSLIRAQSLLRERQPRALVERWRAAQLYSARRWTSEEDQ